MATTLTTGPGALLAADKSLLCRVRRVILVSTSNQAHGARKGLAEAVRQDCALIRARWLRLRDDHLLPIAPIGIDAYPNGRLILRFRVSAKRAAR